MRNINCFHEAVQWRSGEGGIKATLRIIPEGHIICQNYITRAAALSRAVRSVSIGSCSLIYFNEVPHT